MAIRIVRLGMPRARGEGPRLGTVRRPPRGVRKADYARLDYYDCEREERCHRSILRALLAGQGAKLA